MSEDIFGHDQYVEDLFAHCTHEHGVLVCMYCGKPMPAPAPLGYDIWDGEWDEVVP